MIENKHYELIPGEDDKWNVRILEGPYTETIIQYGTLIPTDAGQLNWGMSIIETPDETFRHGVVQFYHQFLKMSIYNPRKR